MIDLNKAVASDSDKQQQGTHDKRKMINNEDKNECNKVNGKEEANVSVNNRTKKKKGNKPKKIPKKRNKVIFKSARKRNKIKERVLQLPIQSFNENIVDLNENVARLNVGVHEV